jgi:hypothetical protein
MKFHGTVGFGVSTEKSPGVWSDEPTERPYTGDILRNNQRYSYGDDVNPDVTISDKISIIGDSFMIENLSTIKYVRWRGGVWAVKSIEVSRPRVLLEIGGLYNGNTAGTA